MKTSNLVIMALLGYITQADAFQVQNEQCSSEEIQECQEGAENWNYYEKWAQTARGAKHMKAYQRWLVKYKKQEEKKQQEEEKKDQDQTDDENQDQDDQDGDQNDGEDNTNFITQKKVQQTCDGSLVRMAHEQGGEIQTQGSKFNDISFPADKTQLYWNAASSKPMKSFYDNYAKGFKRPTELQTTAPSLWGSKDIRPAAVNQGSLGDCWFLAAMAAVGEWKDRTKAIFSGQNEYPSDGKFNIKLWSNGEPQNIAIDDKLAVRPYGNRWATLHTRKSPNGAWWAPMLEKAAAKYYGTFSNMHGGWMVEALYALTGMPTIEQRPSQMSDSQLWQALLDYDKNHDIMTAAVMGSGNKDGLVNNHAYTVLSAYNYKGEKLVKLRNPWGSERYTGPWSDSDTSKWTAEAKQTLGNHHNGNDGAFWMPLNKFKQHIYTIHTALYEDWQTDVKQTSWNRQGTRPKYTIQNGDNQKVVVGISGNSKRMFMDTRCSSDQKTVSMPFSLRSKATGQYVQDDSGATYKWYSDYMGQGWLIFENLPAGEYSLEIRGASNSNTAKGDMPFAVQTFGSASKLSIA